MRSLYMIISTSVFVE